MKYTAPPTQYFKITLRFQWHIICHNHLFSFKFHSCWPVLCNVGSMVKDTSSHSSQVYQLEPTRHLVTKTIFFVFQFHYDQFIFASQIIFLHSAFFISKGLWSCLDLSFPQNEFICTQSKFWLWHLIRKGFVVLQFPPHVKTWCNAFNEIPKF